MTRRAFSVAVLVINSRKVLLIQHKRLGLWLPLGGEIEAGETPHEAARREVREESQLSITFPLLKGTLDGEPSGLIGYEEHAAGSKGEHLNFNFIAFAATREVVGDGSFSDHKWHPLGDIFLYETTKSVHQCLQRVNAIERELRGLRK